jgi:hypothetical protein
MSTTTSFGINATSTGSAAGAAQPHSIWTLAAAGFLAYYITVMWHEIFGHGTAGYLLGARHFILTSTSMFSPDMPGSTQGITLGGRFVAFAGPLANAIMGVAIYPLFRAATRRNANLTLRFFLWLLAALNFFLGFMYMVFSGIFGVGDYAAVIAFLPFHGLLRTLEVLVGGLLCAATVRFFAPSFAEFAENLWRLCLVPYVSATLVFCLTGLRIPNSTHFMLVAVIPASLMGQAILVFITPVARRLRTATPRQEAIRTSPLVIAIALVFVMVVYLTAPGVHFVLP